MNEIRTLLSEIDDGALEKLPEPRKNLIRFMKENLKRKGEKREGENKR